MNDQTFTTVSHQGEDPGSIVGETLHALVELDVWWGSARIGLILASAYFNGQPLTTAEIADLTDTSAETVRKYLKPLMNVGRVRVIQEGRNVRYKAKQEWALKTREMLLRHYRAVQTNCADPNAPGLGFPHPLKAFNLDERASACA